MKCIADLRSDTITRPSPAMLEAMVQAPVGDDVLGDDPTVNRLQEHMARLLNKPAALFVPSGTMANQMAIRTVCEPGDEIIVDETTHCLNYESGAPAALSGVNIRTVCGRRGVFTPRQVEQACRAQGIHFARSRMVVIENTNNRGGGTVWPLDDVRAVAQAAHARGLHVHLDGARLWNASVASGHALATCAACVDSVSLCFSKGLGAPVGSILVGDEQFIERARRFRKMFGGAMRQAGLLAGAALYAVEHNVERLAEDHANARLLAEALAEMPGISIDPATVETNIVIFEIDPALGTSGEFASRLDALGVRMLPEMPTRVRAVTHLDVSREQIEQAIAVLRQVTAG